MDKLFNAYRIPVSDIDSLDSALQRVAEEKLGFIVPGRLLDPENTVGIRRLANSRTDAQATLASEARPWLLFDLDGIPNVLRLDPAREPEATRAWLLSLLAEAVRAADTVMRWSSSQCVDRDGPPSTLNAHVWCWLSEALPPDEAKEMMVRADAHARRVLETIQPGVLDQLDAAQAKGRTKHLVDSKVVEAQQPIYVAPPFLADGMADPFSAEERQVLVRGHHRSVDVDALRAELAELDAATVSVRGPKRTRERRKVASGTESSKPTQPRTVRSVLPLGNYRDLGRDHPLVSEILTLTRETAAAQSSKRAADRVFGMGRMAAETIRLVMARAEWGRRHPDFRAWSAAGGVPDGERDTWLFSIAKCLAHAVPPAAVLDGRLAELVTRLGNALCSVEWTADQWQRGGYGKSVLEKARAAAQGETGSWQGEATDARYRVSAARLRRELYIGDDEIRALRLLSLADGALEKANRRALAEKKPSRKRSLTPDDIAAERARVVALRGEGRSLREIVRETGVPVATVQRIAATMFRGDPICPTDLESKKEERGGSTASESVHAAVEPSAQSSARPAIPSFILRNRAERAEAAKVAEARAARYVGQAERLVAVLGRRRSVPLDEIPATPPLDGLSEEAVAAVVAAQGRLHAAQRKTVCKVETARRREAAKAAREGFWGALEQDSETDGAEVVKRAETRVAALVEHWGGKESRAWAKWKSDQDDSSFRQYVVLGNAKRMVLRAENRRFSRLRALLAA